MYSVEQMTIALEDAIYHLVKAEDELVGLVEYDAQLEQIMDTRKELEQLLDETNEILAKQQEEEQRELEREYYKTRL